MNRNDTDILNDILSNEIVILIVGESVGPDSAKAGHYYSNKRNHFWKLLSYLTDVVLLPSNDKSVLKYKIGLTDIIKDKILLNGVSSEKIPEYFNSLIEKINLYKPKIVVFNGKFKGGKNKEEKAIRKILQKEYKKFFNGWKDKVIIFQCPSSSASVRGIYTAQREEMWIKIAEEYKKHL